MFCYGTFFAMNRLTVYYLWMNCKKIRKSENTLKTEVLCVAFFLYVLYN
jgi:hypothetical protein